MELTKCETDVLVIGAGAAGISAAVEAAEAGVRVTLLAKSPMTKTGITPLGFTGYTAVTGLDSEDSPELHFQDTVIGGRYLSDQNLVEAMTSEGGESVRRLLKYGVKFHEENGVLLIRQMPGMSRPRMLRIPSGGKHFIDVLSKEAKRYSNMTVRTDVAVSELLRKDGRVIGILAFDLKTGTLLMVQAKATVLATGGKEQLWPYTDCPPESTGDGLALAYRAGADLIDLEQELFYPTVVVHPEHIKGLEISYETFLKPGAKILNKLGESIVDVEGGVPTRDQLANQIFREIKEGRGSEHGGVMIDLRDAPLKLKEYVQTYLPAYRRLRHFGIEITEETLEVAPAAHTSLGGVYIDEKGRTGIEGLFACGETAGNVHGANRLAGQAWLDCMVFGCRAGKSAAALAHVSDLIPAQLERVHNAEEELRQCFDTGRKGYRPFEVLQQIKENMWKYVGLRRNASAMREGLERIVSLREERLPRLVVDQDPGYSLEKLQALQVRNLVDVAEMFIRAALYREESRGTHFREDFPEQDDVNWLAHSVIRKNGNQMEVTKTPVRITRLHPIKQESCPKGESKSDR